MFVEYKTRKHVKINDLAMHVRSKIVGTVKFIMVVDDIPYVIWKPVDSIQPRSATNDGLFLIKPDMLRPGKYRTEK